MAGFNFQKLINEVESVAHVAAEVLPGAGLVDEGAQIAKAIVDLISGVKSAGKGDVTDLDAARHTLEATIDIESQQLSKDLRG